MSNIVVTLSELENATTFKEIFDVYMDALEGTGTNHNYEKVVARDSLCNLAEMLDGQWFTGFPMGVEDWGKVNREKHGVEDE